MKFQLTSKGELDFKWFFGLKPEDQKLAMQSLKDAEDIEGMLQLEAALSHAVLFLYDKHKANDGEVPKALERDLKHLAKNVRAAPQTRLDEVTSRTNATTGVQIADEDKEETEEPKQRKTKHRHCVIL